MKWNVPPAEVQKLNDLIKWRAGTYTPFESLKPTAVAEHKKQQEKMKREAQQEQPNRRQPEVMATGKFNPIQPNRREKIVATEYHRIQCEKRAEREYLDRRVRQEANGGQAPARPQTISDAWTEDRAEGTVGVNLS